MKLPRPTHPHLDTHMGVLQAGANRDDLYEVYLDLAEEFRVPVRISVRQQTEKELLQARVRAESRGGTSSSRRSQSCRPA